MPAKQKAHIFLLVLCLAFTSICSAIGFGELKVYSYLGEPLYAEVALTGYQDMDPQMLKAALADAKDFARAGLDRPYSLTFIGFQIVNYDGNLYVVVRTAKPIQTPYLEFLLELSWPGGNLIKEYTILLDPPPADLTKESRPKGVSQISEEQARQKAFAVDSIQQQMDMQKAQQQKAEVEKSLTNINRDGSKFSDNTFDYNEPPAKADLVPGAVPEVLDDEVYQQQRAQFEQQQQAITKQKETKKSLLGKVVSGIDQVQDNFEPDLSVNKILDEEKQAQGSVTSPAPTAPVAPIPVPAIPKPPNNVTPPPQLDTKTNPATTPGVSGTPDEQVNFSQVIPPAGGPKARHDQAQLRSKESLPADPASIAPAQPTAEKGNYLYLGVILSLLLIAAGIGVAIKRGVFQSFAHKHSQAQFANTIPVDTPPVAPMPTASTDVPVSEDPVDKLLNEELDEFTSVAEQDVEQIELATPADVASVPVEPLSTVSSSDAGVVAQPTQETGTVPSKAANEQGAPQTTTRTDAPVSFNTEPITAAKSEATQTNNTPVNSNLDAASQFVSQVTATQEQGLDTANLQTENADLQQIEQEFESIDLDDFGVPVTPPVPESPSAAPIASALEVTEVSNQEFIEDAASAAAPGAIEVPQTPLDQDFGEAAIPRAAITETFNTAAETIVTPVEPVQAKPESETVTGPTMVDFSKSELKLSEEGATLVSESSGASFIDNSDVVKAKLTLAKQYIETGDRESAKDLLREVIEIAKDDQKVEAQVLLNTIV